MPIDDLLSDSRLTPEQKQILIQGAKDTGRGVVGAMNPAFAAMNLESQGGKALGLDKPLPEPAPRDMPTQTDPWSQGAGPTVADKSLAPLLPASADTAKGMAAPASYAAGGQPPVDWMKRAADETGNSVDTTPIDAAQADTNRIADMGADIAGAVGSGQAAATKGAMSANAIDAAKYDTQREGLDSHIQSLNNRAAAIDEDVASSKIDPDRKWNSMSTGGKVLSQLAVAFGALGQAFGQKDNIGLDNLRKHIDSDVEAQKQAIESKRGLSKNIKGLVGEYHQQGLDLDAAQAKARQAHWEDALNQSQMFVDAAKGPEALQQALLKQKDIATAATKARVEAQKAIVRQATADHEHAVAAAQSAAVAAEKERYNRNKDQRDYNLKELETIGRLQGEAGKGQKDMMQHFGDIETERGIPEATSAIGALTAHKGDIPGTGMVSNWLREKQDEGGMLGGLAGRVRGTEAGMTDAELSQLATGLIKSGGGRPTDEMIKEKVKLLRGNGTPEALRKNLAVAQSQIAATQSAIRAEDPAQYDQFRGQDQYTRSQALKNKLQPIGDE